MSVLQKLKDEHVFSVEMSADKERLFITEECDGVFYVELDRRQVETLITEFLSLLNMMVDDSIILTALTAEDTNGDMVVVDPVNQRAVK